MFNTEKLQEKWNPVLKHDGLPEIKDNYRKAVTAQLLENQERFMREEKNILTEAPTNAGPINTPTTGSGANFGFEFTANSSQASACHRRCSYEWSYWIDLRNEITLRHQSGNEAFFDGERTVLWYWVVTSTASEKTQVYQRCFWWWYNRRNMTLLQASSSSNQSLGKVSTAFMEMAFSIDRIAVKKVDTKSRLLS